MSKETEFVKNARAIVFASCSASLAKAKVGDTLVLDDQYKVDHGNWHELRAGDEFRVDLVDDHNKLSEPHYWVTVTKTPSAEGYLPRYKVGDKIEFHEYMQTYAYLRLKDDHEMEAQLKQLCRDYLDGLL